MSNKLLNWGTRHVRVYKLAETGTHAGLIDTELPTGYLSPWRVDGVHILGATAFQISEPPPRIQDHPGDDGIIGSDSMPAMQGETAQISASPWDLDLVALLENTKVSSVGEGSGLSRGTNRQGSEPRFAVWFYQQTLDAETGQRKWRLILYPSAKVVPVGNGGGDSPQQTQYQVSSTRVTKHIWGATLTYDIDGATHQRKWEGIFEHEPVGFRAITDGSRTEFLFDTNLPAYSVDTISVWKNGDLVGSGYTSSVTGIVFDTAPLSTDYVFVLYEKATS